MADTHVIVSDIGLAGAWIICKKSDCGAERVERERVERERGEQVELIFTLQNTYWHACFTLHDAHCTPQVHSACFTLHDAHHMVHTKGCTLHLMCYTYMHCINFLQHTVVASLHFPSS